MHFRSLCSVARFLASVEEKGVKESWQLLKEKILSANCSCMEES